MKVSIDFDAGADKPQNLSYHGKNKYSAVLAILTKGVLQC